MPENHLAYFVSEIVDRLDLQKFYARYEGDGRRNQPYDPAMLVKILVYGYATGVFYGGLRVVGLFKTPAHLHDARLGIGEVVLSFVLGLAERVLKGPPGEHEHDHGFVFTLPNLFLSPALQPAPKLQRRHSIR